MSTGARASPLLCESLEQTRRRREEAERRVRERHQHLTEEYQKNVKKTQEERERLMRELREKEKKELQRQQIELQKRLEQAERDRARRKELERNGTSSPHSQSGRRIAFGSSTPRELSYLDRLSKDQKVYDKRLSPSGFGNSRPNTTTKSMSTSMYVPSSGPRSTASISRLSATPRRPKPSGREKPSEMTQSLYGALPHSARDLQSRKANTKPPAPARRSIPFQPQKTIPSQAKPMPNKRRSHPVSSSSTSNTSSSQHIIVTSQEYTESEEHSSVQLIHEAITTEVDSFKDPATVINESVAEVPSADKTVCPEVTVPHTSESIEEEEASQQPTDLPASLNDIESISFISEVEEENKTIPVSVSLADELSLAPERQPESHQYSAKSEETKDMEMIVACPSEEEVVHSKYPVGDPVPPVQNDVVSPEAIENDGKLVHDEHSEEEHKRSIDSPAKTSITSSENLLFEESQGVAPGIEVKELVYGIPSNDAKEKSDKSQSLADELASAGSDFSGPVQQMPELKNSMEKPEAIPDENGHSKPPTPPLSEKIDVEQRRLEEEQRQKESEAIRARLAAVKARAGRVSPPSETAATITPASAPSTGPGIGLSASTAALLQRLKESGRTSGAGAVSRILDRHASDPKLEQTPEDPVPATMP